MGQKRCTRAIYISDCVKENNQEKPKLKVDIFI